MSRAYDDSHYLARTLAASMLELDPGDQNGIISFFQDELSRLGIAHLQAAAQISQERGGHSVAGSAEQVNSSAAAPTN